MVDLLSAVFYGICHISYVFGIYNISYIEHLNRPVLQNSLFYGIFSSLFLFLDLSSFIGARRFRFLGIIPLLVASFYVMIVINMTVYHMVKYYQD